MFCSNCGKELPNGSKFCFCCGTNLQNKEPKSTEQQIQEHTAPSLATESGYSYKTAQILGMIPIPGLHRFYLGMPGSAIAQFISSLFFIGIIWWLVDNIRLLTNNFKDREGKQLACYSKTFAFFSLIIWVALFSNAILNGNKASQEKVETSDTSTTEISQNETVTTGTDESIEEKQEILNSAERSSQSTNTAEYEAPIRDGAIYLYPETKKELQKAGFSKTLKKLGLDNIKKCNKLFPLAAKKAAKNKKCDAVMTVDISDKSTKDNIIIYVHAENFTKFYFTEQELMEDGPVKSEQEKLAPLLIRHEVMAEEVIKSKLNFPSTYDRHELGVFHSRTTPGCNEITIEFSAKNAYNLELTYIATVQFDKDSNVVGFRMQEKQ